MSHSKTPASLLFCNVNSVNPCFTQDCSFCGKYLLHLLKSYLYKRLRWALRKLTPNPIVAPSTTVDGALLPNLPSFSAGRCPAISDYLQPRLSDPLSRYSFWERRGSRFTHRQQRSLEEGQQRLFEEFVDSPADEQSETGGHNNDEVGGRIAELDHDPYGCRDEWSMEKID